jgi:glycerophosphoryl diester phosphodiesterase
MRFSRHLRALDWLVAKPIAHRGLHDRDQGIIENTASAFSAAIHGGYAIECDLQISADGEAMVFHDKHLGRLTPVEGAVKNFSVRELKQMPIVGSTDRMQTLNELLDQVGGKVPLLIELKTHWNHDIELVQRTLKVLESYAGPYALMSFDPEMVAALAEFSPRIVRGITADRTVDAYFKQVPVGRRVSIRQFQHLAHTRPHFVSYDFAGLPFYPVQALRQAGYPVLSWTIANVHDAKRARRYSDQITFEGFTP